MRSSIPVGLHIPSLLAEAHALNIVLAFKAKLFIFSDSMSSGDAIQFSCGGYSRTSSTTKFYVSSPYFNMELQRKVYEGYHENFNTEECCMDIYGISCAQCQESSGMPNAFALRTLRSADRAPKRMRKVAVNQINVKYIYPFYMLWFWLRTYGLLT